MTKAKNQFAFLDLLLLTIASVFIVIVFRACLYNLVDNEVMGKDLSILSFGISWTIFVFQYKALRKPKVFLAWSTLALVMLGMSFWLCKNTGLSYLGKDNSEIYNYASGLKVPAILLIIFWICRKIAKKYYNTELLLPNRSFNRIDYVEKRKFNLMDYVWMIASIIPILADLFH